MIVLRLVLFLRLDFIILVVDVVDIIVVLLLIVVVALFGLIDFVLFLFLLLLLDFFLTLLPQLADCKFLLQGIVDGKSSSRRVFVVANPIVLLWLVTGEFVKPGGLVLQVL